MATAVASATEQRVVLHGIPWDLYERILAAHEESSSPRFFYDRGELEIVMPLPEHERYNRMLQLLVSEAAVELEIEVASVGSTTFRREDVERGFEADSAFYIQNVARMRNRNRIDLRLDPPPDLAIEVEVSRSLIARLPIYAALGVPELWRYDGRRLRILVLSGDAYGESPVSRAIPRISGAALAENLRLSGGLSETGWLLRVREWARKRPAPQPE